MKGRMNCKKGSDMENKDIIDWNVSWDTEKDIFLEESILFITISQLV